MQRDSGIQTATKARARDKATVKETERTQARPCKKVRGRRREKDRERNADIRVERQIVSAIMS